MASKAPASPVPIIEADFSRGIIRDEPRSSIPPGGLYDAVDWMLEKPGFAYKRGGTIYAGPAMSSGSYAHSLFYAAFPTGAALLALSNTGLLWQVRDTETNLRGTLSTAFLTTEKPKIRVDTVVYCANDGLTAPKKAYFDGTSVAVKDLGGNPPAGKFSEVFSTRLVLANVDGDENRVYFSPVPNIEDAWDSTNAYLDADYEVRGLAAINSGLLAFSQGHTEIFTGTTPPPVTDMSRRTVAAIGLDDARSIAKSDNNVIFANTHGVFVTNGGAFDSLTKKADGSGIASAWQAQFDGYDPTTWTITGEVFRDFYWVSILDNQGGLVNNWKCHLPSQAWTRIDNWTPMMFTTSVGIEEEMFFASRSETGIHQVAGVFTPDASNKADADGTNVEPQLQYRMTGDGPALKAYGFGRLTYDMRDAAADNPSVTISIGTGIEASSFSTVPEVPLKPTSDAARKRFTIAKDAQAVNIELTQNGPSAKTELYALEAEVRPYPFSHDGIA